MAAKKKSSRSSSRKSSSRSASKKSARKGGGARKKSAAKKTAAAKKAAGRREPAGRDKPVPDDTEGIPGCDPETKADIQQLFRDAVEKATTSVETYTEIASRAATRLAQGNVDPAAWSKDFADATALWVSDVTSVWTTWTQALNRVSGKDDDDSGPSDG